MRYKGMVFLGLVLLSCHAAAGDGMRPVSHTASSTLQSLPARSAAAAQQDAVIAGRRAVFGRESASSDVRHIADWVVDSGNNQGLPFVIVDKTNARVFVFHANGLIRGAAPALLGLARGDDTVPGIGDRALAAILPEERTTPAGRFVAQRGMSLRGEDVLWVDYESGVSLHRVVTNNAQERRLERLATPTPEDNRISYGCINVPAAFYNNVVSPSFAGTAGIVYVLPETRPLRQVFNSYDVEATQQYAVQAR
jgi:hypothetical protein